MLSSSRPPLAPDVVGLAGQEVESILVALLVVVGVNLAWFGVSEPTDPANA